jgi:hypothetical protein
MPPPSKLPNLNHSQSAIRGLVGTAEALSLSQRMASVMSKRQVKVSGPRRDDACRDGGHPEPLPNSLWCAHEVECVVRGWGCPSAAAKATLPGLADWFLPVPSQVDELTRDQLNQLRVVFDVLDSNKDGLLNVRSNLFAKNGRGHAGSRVCASPH